MIAITADYDKVVIEGVVTPRPPTISVSEWLNFWERAVALEDSRQRRVYPPSNYKRRQR